MKDVLETLSVRDDFKKKHGKFNELVIIDFDPSPPPLLMKLLMMKYFIFYHPPPSHD